MGSLMPGSVFLQSCFYGLAAVIVAGTTILLYRASIACGDSPGVARINQRRFLVRALAWTAAVSLAAFSGAMNPARRPPVVFVLMLATITTLGVVIARSETGRRFAHGLPLAWLVGFQAFRLPLELAMHRAHSEGLMPIQMSYSGQNFDIVTGATALVLGLVMAVREVPRWLVQAWNVLGLALLANILGVAMLSTPVFAYFGPDHLNVFVMRMPYTLLPAVMVLAAWAGHLIVFRALRLAR